jgi:hypothetical protein
MMTVSGAGAGGGFGAGGGGGVGVGPGGGMASGGDPVALCWTRCDNPAILSMPLRSPAVFASVTNSALPLPDASELTTRTHGTSLDALHLHPGTAETKTLKAPPAAETCEEELPSSKRHSAAS